MAKRKKNMVHIKQKIEQHEPH